MSCLARPITNDEVVTYNRTGVVLLRGVLDLRWVNSLRRAIDDAVRSLEASPAGYNLSLLRRAAQQDDNTALKRADGGQHDVTGIVKYIKASGMPFLLDGGKDNGSFILDTGITARVDEFKNFALKGPGPEIAAALLGAQDVRFFNDQIFVKEAGTPDRTAFHQDATYFELAGDQCCVLWVPADPVSLENGAMLYWRGSHLDGRLYAPNVFVSRTPLPGAHGERLPDIESHQDQYDLVYFETEPGDVLVHHYRTVHGAGGNNSRYQVRRAASLRYCGDDIRFMTRPWAPKQLHHSHRLRDGDPLSGADFPLVWQTHREAAA